MTFHVPESFSFSPTWIFAGIAIVVALGEYCSGIFLAKHAFPLPPGPPRRWFWESAMPSNKSVVFVLPKQAVQSQSLLQCDS
jgi:hypothetical protein